MLLHARVTGILPNTLPGRPCAEHQSRPAREFPFDTVQGTARVCVVRQISRLASGGDMMPLFPVSHAPPERAFPLRR